MRTPRPALRAAAYLVAAILWGSLPGMAMGWILDETASPGGEAGGTPALSADGGEQTPDAAPASEPQASEKPSGEAEEAADAGGMAADEPPLEPGVDPNAEPLRVFASIESAWALGAADSLLVHFGESKVSLAFSRCGPRGGIFTRAQADYLLTDLFAYSVTEKFQFEKFRNIQKDGQLPYAVADRVYRLENGILYHDQVYVSLRKEGNDWKIAEIKSIDR